MSYDPECLQLAGHFLGGCSEGLKVELAEHLQDTVEKWVAGKAIVLANKIVEPSKVCGFSFCPHPFMCKDFCLSATRPS